MLNYIALFFELAGFSLVLLEIYYPVRARAFESWLDSYSDIKNILLPSFSETIFYKVCAFIFPYLAIVLIITLVISIGSLSPKEDSPAYNNAFLDYFYGTLFFIVFLSILELIRKYIFAVVSNILRMFITFSNTIHPDSKSIGGAGLIIAFIGLAIDTYQAFGSNV